MIKRLIDLSVQYRYAVVATTALLSLLGWWSMYSMPLDVLPDLSEPQVLISTDWDRSAEAMENLVSFPIVTALEGTPKIRSVRAVSSFGSSVIYVIFEDNTDLEWARARVGEKLLNVVSLLPEGAKPKLGPASSGINWIFQYALIDKKGRLTLSELRQAQDAVLRPALRVLPGVGDVASVGGFEQQFQINVDPGKLLAYAVSIRDVVNAVRDGNQESSGRLIEVGRTEYMVRGRGGAHTLNDFLNIVVKANPGAKPVQIRDLGEAVLGPQMRQGLAEYNGQGEAVSGIVIARSGQDTLALTERVKTRLAELARSLPAGAEVVPVYDRSVLIHQAISSLRWTIAGVLITVALVIVLFLLDLRSALIPVITIPVTLLITFIPLRLLGVSANIMSLAGLAIASSELVNSSIIVVEQTQKKLEEWRRSGHFASPVGIVVDAIKSVAAPSFFALIIIAVSFLPVFALEAQEGRMFKPFALAKTIAMLVAAVLTLTLDPALRVILLQRRRTGNQSSAVYERRPTSFLAADVEQESHPVSRLLNRIYRPMVLWALGHRLFVLGGVFAMMSLTIPVYLNLAHEFMPDLYEGSLLYMPATMPGLPVEDARRLLIATDHLLLQFPEVDQVLGKAGRADTTTDPAPLSMFETIIILKPRSEWRHVDTWYSGWAPSPLRRLFRHITPDTISREDLVDQMNRTLAVPGFNNVWTMPIRGRLDMLATGIRTPLGVKVTGTDSASVAIGATKVEQALRRVSGSREIFTEHSGRGHYLDVQWRRDDLARYGLRIGEVQDLVQYAIGGENVSEVTEGHLRYPVNVRLLRDFRADPQTLSRLVVSCGGTCQVALGDLADIKLSEGPDMIRDEDGLLTAYVFITLDGREPASYLTDARRQLAQVALPAGVSLIWSGQYESMARVAHRLTLVIPGTVVLIALLLMLTTRSWVKTAMVLTALPFSAIGAVWFLSLAHFKLSVAVLVGIVALMGVDAETGVFMLLYLDLAYEEAQLRHRDFDRSELQAAILRGAVQRIRPKIMMFATTCIGLFPVMWSNDVGSDLLKRMAAPMVGGIITSVLLELLIYPVLYDLWRGRSRLSQPLLRHDTTREAVLSGSWRARETSTANEAQTGDSLRSL